MVLRPLVTTCSLRAARYDLPVTLVQSLPVVCLRENTRASILFGMLMVRSLAESQYSVQYTLVFHSVSNAVTIPALMFYAVSAAIYTPICQVYKLH